jgi:hypothetical protein
MKITDEFIQKLNDRLDKKVLTYSGPVVNMNEIEIEIKFKLRIVGTKHKNLVKKDLVKLALEKFKNEIINNSLQNFKFFSANFKSYLKSNQKLYKSELFKLFTVVN